jgi:hypothetical protein
MEALSCQHTKGIPGYYMITRPTEKCYDTTNHIILCTISAALLLGYTVGFPLLVLRKLHEIQGRVHADQRFMERFDFFYEFYNPKFPSFWIMDFLATMIVASGKSFLYPHSNFQMGISVAIFGHKVVYIMVRRPYIDWLTDVIQGCLAIVSLIAINVNFFERRGLLDKIPSFNAYMALCMLCIFALVIIITLIIVMIVLVKKQPDEPPYVTALKKQGAEAGEGEMVDEEKIDVVFDLSEAVAASPPAPVPQLAPELQPKPQPAVGEEDDNGFMAYVRKSLGLSNAEGQPEQGVTQLFSARFAGSDAQQAPAPVTTPPIAPGPEPVRSVPELSNNNAEPSPVLAAAELPTAVPNVMSPR